MSSSPKPVLVARLTGAVLFGVLGAHMVAQDACAARMQNWPTYGLSYVEACFSRLDQLDASNVKNLGLAWFYNLESTRGVEAAPLVVDGIVCVSTSWSVVHSIDARSGERKWAFDPMVSREAVYKGCCDVVNRGGSIPNRGYMDAAFIENLDKLVFSGCATARCMPDFSNKLTLADDEKTKAVIQSTADAIRPK